MHTRLVHAFPLRFYMRNLQESVLHNPGQCKRADEGLLFQVLQICLQTIFTYMDN